MRDLVRFAIASMLFVFVAGCPAKSDDDATKRSAPATSASCTSVGQSCQFAPGKLGSCVKKDDCTVDCFVCQSQH